jgi:hypothetical protein
MQQALSGTLQSYDQLPILFTVQLLAKYFIFSKENATAKGRKFQDIKDTKIVVDDCFVKLLDRCKKCVAVKRD